MTRLHDEIEQYRKASSEVWACFKKHYFAPKNDKDWSAWVSESDAVWWAWKDTPQKNYVTKYLLACREEIEKLTAAPNQVPGQMSLFDERGEHE